MFSSSIPAYWLVEIICPLSIAAAVKIFESKILVNGTSSAALKFSDARAAMLAWRLRAVGLSSRTVRKEDLWKETTTAGLNNRTFFAVGQQQRTPNNNEKTRWERHPQVRTLYPAWIGFADQLRNHEEEKKTIDIYGSLRPKYLLTTITGLANGAQSAIGVSGHWSFSKR